MRTIKASRSGPWVVWCWVTVSILLVALNTDRVCGQFRPPTGPSAQDISTAKVSAQATSSAQWWTSALVLGVLGWFAYSIRGHAISFLRTLGGGYDRGTATTDPETLITSDTGPEQLAQGGEKADAATEPKCLLRAKPTPHQG